MPILVLGLDRYKIPSICECQQRWINVGGDLVSPFILLLEQVTVNSIGTVTEVGFLSVTCLHLIIAASHVSLLHHERV